MNSVELVKEMIKNYPDNVKGLKKLEDEIVGFKPITPSEVIDMLNFPGKSRDEVRIKKERSKSKVFQIASSYRGLAWRLNEDTKEEFQQEYDKLSREVEFIRYAIRALPKFYKKLMSYAVLQGKSWSEVCNHFSISGTDYFRAKEKAISRLAETFYRQHEYFGFRKEDICDGTVAEQL